MNSTSTLKMLSYEELDREIDFQELSTETVEKLYTSYADFFVLPLLQSNRFKKEVLTVNYTMHQLSLAFDELSQKSAHYQALKEIGQLPATDYREDNFADRINVAYINSLLGNYLNNGKLGGIAKGKTEALLNFLDIYRVHWKFIQHYKDQLSSAAKDWYKKFATDILEKNKQYARKQLREKKLLNAASKLNITLEERDDLTYILEQVDKIDLAQAHRSFKEQVKHTIQNALKRFQREKEIKLLRSKPHVVDQAPDPSLNKQEKDTNNLFENSNETQTSHSGLFAHSHLKRKNEGESHEYKAKIQSTAKIVKKHP